MTMPPGPAMQFILMAVVLIAGFLLGAASRPGTRKWKRRVREQSDSFTAYHDDAEDRLRAATDRARSLEAENAALKADHEEAIAALKAAPVRAVATQTPAAAETETADPADIVAHHDDDVAQAAPDVSKPVALAAARPAFGIDLARPQPIDAAPSAPEPVPALPMTPAATDAAPAPIGPAEPETPTSGWFGGRVRDDLTRVRGIDALLNTRLFGLGVLRYEDLEKLSAEDEIALEQRLSLPAGRIARDQWRAQAALLRAGNVAEHDARFGAVAEPVPA